MGSSAVSSLEVEFKFRVTDYDAVQAAALALGAIPGTSGIQEDEYFGHPVRDYVETDEALRIRITQGSTRLTYKGPLIDPVAKTRREIEIPVSGGSEAASQMRNLLVALGFKPVRLVRKHRQSLSLRFEERNVELVCDTVDGLGTFVEIEILAEEKDKDTAREILLRLASQLGLTQPIRTSYLSMLMSDVPDQE